MLTSITPLGEQGRHNRYGVTVAAYVLGSVLGGLTTGLVLGAVGMLALSGVPGPVRLALAGAACLVALASDLGVFGRRLPGGRRQVDEDWLVRYRGWVYGLAFGYQLGLAVVTIITSAVTYAVLTVMLLTASPVAGAVLGATFGLVRGLPVLGLRHVAAHEDLLAAARRLERLAAPASRATAAVLTAAAAVLLTGAVTA